LLNEFNHLMCNSEKQPFHRTKVNAKKIAKSLLSVLLCHIMPRRVTS